MPMKRKLLWASTTMNLIAAGHFAKAPVLLVGAEASFIAAKMLHSAAQGKVNQPRMGPSFKSL